MFVEEQQWYLFNGCRGGKEVYIFPEAISLKVNIIVWLEFELTYFEVAVQQFKHYAM